LNSPCRRTRKRCVSPMSGKRVPTKTARPKRPSEAAAGAGGGAVPPLPHAFPLPFSASPGAGGVDDALSLPPAWVYRVMGGAMAARGAGDASVEVEAVRAVACAAGEFVAFLCHHAREVAGAGGEVGAAEVLRALEELGYERYAPLLQRWLCRAEVAGARGALAATVAAGGGGPSGGEADGECAMAEDER